METRTDSDQRGGGRKGKERGGSRQGTCMDDPGTWTIRWGLCVGGGAGSGQDSGEQWEKLGQL